MISENEHLRKRIEKSIVSAVLSASVMIAGLTCGLGQPAQAEPHEEESAIVLSAGNAEGSEETEETPYTVVDRFTIRQGFRFPSLNVIYDGFLGDLTGMVRSWYVAIDDTAVARAPSCEILTALLDRILVDYSVENASSVSFAQDVTVSYGYVSDSLPCEPDEIYATLCPASENGLTVTGTVCSEEIRTVARNELKLRDPNLYPHESGEVIEEGADGEKLVTTTQTFVNGSLVDTVTEERLLSSPVAAIVVQGVKEYTYESTGEYRWPVNGRISSYYGYRDISVGSSYHKGIDITKGYGAVIRAADSGTVIHSGWSGGYGYLVKIQHDNGDITYYAHCSTLLVSVGERVYQGQEIAKMGSTGVSTGVHLHFEIRKNGTAVNPMKYLP